MSRSYTRHTPEKKARAVSLCLKALTRGWSIARFSRWSGVAKGTLAEWMGEDQTFPRFTRAMQTKALLLPDEALDVARSLIVGRKVVRQDDKGQFVAVTEKVDPKAAGVFLRHLEFRMMREIKPIYEPSRTVEHNHNMNTMSDREVEEKYAEISARGGLLIDGKVIK